MIGTPFHAQRTADLEAVEQFVDLIPQEMGGDKAQYTRCTRANSVDKTSRGPFVPMKMTCPPVIVQTQRQDNPSGEVAILNNDLLTLGA